MGEIVKRNFIVEMVRNGRTAVVTCIYLVFGVCVCVCVCVRVRARMRACVPAEKDSFL